MAETFGITLCLSPGPRRVCEWALQVPVGATVAQALALAMQAPDWPAQWPEASCQTLQASLWGRKCARNAVLRAGDRIELCRDLRVDPKVARRERFSQQGARRAGLFAKKRPGAAAGY